MDHRSGMQIGLPQSSCGTRVITEMQGKIWLLAVAILALLLLALPVHAQTALPPMPENASPQSYGDGWACNVGYRLDAGRCAAVVIPRNAYETNQTYGRGWECFHGYRAEGETDCVAVAVPEDGYLDPSGQRWHCSRGFMKIDDTCQEIILPANAYLADTSFGLPWVCHRGFEAENDTCVAIAVPANAYLNASRYGQPWTCERGYFEQDGSCTAVVVPENAYFDDSTYGTGWKCARGYAVSGQSCAAIDIPENAHLDRSGNRWECNRNFQKSKGLCLLNN